VLGAARQAEVIHITGVRAVAGRHLRPAVAVAANLKLWSPSLSSVPDDRLSLSTALRAVSPRRAEMRVAWAHGSNRR